MNVAKPIRPEEYKQFYEELYDMSSGTEGSLKAAVDLDEDPSINPKGINEKLAKAQAWKNRVLVILNRAVRSKHYWTTMHDRLKAKFDAEMKTALLDPEVKKGKNAEERSAIATTLAGPVMVSKFFKGEGEFDDHFYKVNRDLQDSIAFLSDVRNIYDNLDDTARNLAIQLKGIQTSMKIYGDATEENPQEAVVA